MSHPQTLHQEVSNIYLILGLIVFMPIMWHMIRNNTIAEWHPFTNVKYSLTWYLILFSYNIRPVLYVVVALLAKPKHYFLLISFLAYEFILFMDYVLIYSESPAYGGMAVMMSFYMAWYAHKYE